MAKANGTLGKREVEVLALLAKAKKPLSRADMAKATGQAKGWSRLLGAATKDGLGASGDDSLEGRGYVASSKEAGDRSIAYTITAAGRKALDKAKADSKAKPAKADKAAAKADKGSN